MEHPQDDESASINRRDTAAVRAQYAISLAEQPLSARTREAYLAAVTAFLAWLAARDAGPGDALLAPRARDLAAPDYKRHLKVERGLSPASVNQALAGMDHLFRFLGLGAAIVRREELPRSAPRALDADQKRDLLRAAEESTARDRAIVALLLFTGLRLSEAAALQVADVRLGAQRRRRRALGQGRRVPRGRPQRARTRHARRVGDRAHEARAGGGDELLRRAHGPGAVVALD
jgi:integrase